MKNDTRLYIISFGDSKQYRMYYGGNSASSPVRTTRLTDVERELNAYLRHAFPTISGTFFYTSPKVSQVPSGSENRYAEYPMLDSSAIPALKELLATEMREMIETGRREANA